MSVKSEMLGARDEFISLVRNEPVSYTHLDVYKRQVVGRGMKGNRGTAARVFAALAHARINIKMIDQGSSESNIIVGIRNDDFEDAIRAIYDVFVTSEI